MANRIAGNVYIIDSAQNTQLSWPSAGVEIMAVHFYSTDTTGELRLVMASNTTNTVFHIRNNNAQPYNLPFYINGVEFGPLVPITVTAGTAFIYFK